MHHLNMTHNLYACVTLGQCTVSKLSFLAKKKKKEENPVDQVVTYI